jgi:hypothetical protein
MAVVIHAGAAARAPEIEPQRGKSLLSKSRRGPDHHRVNHISPIQWMGMGDHHPAITGSFAQQGLEPDGLIFDDHRSFHEKISFEFIFWRFSRMPG